MTKKLYSYELIEALCNAFGPSGCEDAVAELICEQIDDLDAEIKRDRLGNLICRFKSGTNAPARKKLMISAHMDEVGFMISEITEKGYLRFGEVGGISAAVLSGRHVAVGDEKMQVGGVIASKAIHQKSAEDRLKPEKEENLFIDIGVDSEDEARKYADVGTFATFAANFGRFGKDGKMLRSKALDDRLGCALIIELMRKLGDDAASLGVEIYFCFTTREEVGISGAEVAANAIAPDYAIVLETTAVADLPDVEDAKRVARLGEGGAISLMDRGTIYDRGLIDAAMKTAEEHGVKVQIKKYVSGGNDAAKIHKSGVGVRTLALSAPTRYLHSPNCVACYDDYEAMLDLLYKMIIKGRIK